MARDKDGFMTVEERPDALQGAEKVMAFSKVGGILLARPLSPLYSGSQIYTKCVCLAHTFPHTLFLEGPAALR